MDTQPLLQKVGPPALAEFGASLAEGDELAMTV
jgi:hypothetical protein